MILPYCGIYLQKKTRCINKIIANLANERHVGNNERTIKFELKSLIYVRAWIDWDYIIVPVPVKSSYYAMPGHAQNKAIIEERAGINQGFFRNCIFKQFQSSMGP